VERIGDMDRLRVGSPNLGLGCPKPKYGFRGYLPLGSLLSGEDLDKFNWEVVGHKSRSLDP
jgi:hypothetical protein